MIGKTLGKYRVVEQIGRGGMAEVYKAYHPGLDRYVAIKLMHTFLADEEGFLDRFQREARSVARLRHPSIVQMYDFDAEGDVYYMVMEYLEGPSLKNYLAELADRGEWLTLEQAVRIVRDVGEALDYAHRRDMIHRDVKPANIMMTADGGAILTDFGIVKMLSATAMTKLTASGAMIGTPAYMAPEQSMGEAGDDRADIYSLGIVLYQLVTGQLPYDADTPMAIVLKHLSAPLPIPSTLNPDLPQGIERVILKALAKDPKDRYQSVREMLDHLERAMQGLQVPEVDPAITVANQSLMGDADLSTPVPPARTVADGPAVPRRRFPLWAIGLAGLTLAALLFGGTFVFVLGGDEQKSTATPTTVKVAAATATPFFTSTSRPTHTPDARATDAMATLFAAAETASAPTATGTPTPTPTETPTPTNTPIPTPTPNLTATALAACNMDATLEEHVSVRPGTWFAPGQAFQKTWRLLNSGECDWPPGTTLAFTSGDALGAEDPVEVEQIMVGEMVDISVDLQAPGSNGTYAGTWQLQRDDGTPFGNEFTVEINVGPTPTPLPTWTPRPTPTPTSLPTPVGPLVMTAPTIRPGSCWANADEGTWGAILEWSVSGGTGTYEYYFAERKLDGPYFAFSSQAGKNWVGTLRTYSGDEMVKYDLFIHPSQCAN